MNELIDKVLTSLAISTDGSYLRWQTDLGEFSYYAEGDCCSHSWFEAVTGVDNFGRVVAVDHIEMPEPDQGDHECLQSYGVKITTEIGHVVLEYRNSSNGYYGGWCQYMQGNPVPATADMREITADWVVNQ